MAVAGATQVAAQEPVSPYTQGGQQNSAGLFQLVGGKASAGSALQIVSTPTHQGKQALRLHYIFSDHGYLEFHLSAPPVVVRETGRITFAM